MLMADTSKSMALFVDHFMSLPPNSASINCPSIIRRESISL